MSITTCAASASAVTPSGYHAPVARRADDLGPAIVVVNPEEDCSAVAGRIIIDEILASPEEPTPQSLHAAETLRELRDAPR